MLPNRHWNCGFFIEIDAIDDFAEYVEIDFGGLAQDCQFLRLRVEDRLADDIGIDIDQATKTGNKFRDFILTDQAKQQVRIQLAHLNLYGQ